MERLVERHGASGQLAPRVRLSDAGQHAQVRQDQERDDREGTEVEAAGQADRGRHQAEGAREPGGAASDEGNVGEGALGCGHWNDPPGSG